LDHLVPFTGELFSCRSEDRELAAARVAPLPNDLHDAWLQAVAATMSEATLATIADDAITAGADRSPHDDDFAGLIGEMQVLARAHPGATW
jgi:ring-1,2-phenylacetyl-CoA epoxidase subunit PaaC